MENILLGYRCFYKEATLWIVLWEMEDAINELAASGKIAYAKFTLADEKISTDHLGIILTSRQATDEEARYLFTKVLVKELENDTGEIELD
jgi:hypothetical protein